MPYRQPQQVADYTHKGMTLVELLVVIAIIGIGLISIVPKLGDRVGKGDPQEAFFKELLAEHLAEARRQGISVKIMGFKGSANIEKYDGSRVTIPNVKSVQAAIINGSRTPGVEYYITVYPDGLCDHFELETDRKEVIESYPLLMQTSRRKI